MYSTAQHSALAIYASYLSTAPNSVGAPADSVSCMLHRADDVGTEQRRRGAGRSELLRLCRIGAKERWVMERKVLPRRWRYQGTKRAWGWHPLPATTPSDASSCADDSDERVFVGASLGSGCEAMLSSRGTTDLLHHIEGCAAAKHARQWWLDHWERLMHAEGPASAAALPAPAERTLQQPPPPPPPSQSPSPPPTGFLWCFGKPSSQQATVLHPDLKHPDHRKAQREAALNKGAGKFGTVGTGAYSAASRVASSASALCRQVATVALERGKSLQLVVPRLGCIGYLLILAM